MRAEKFEWDPEKSQRNLEKHGISFAEARALWEGPVIELGTNSGTDDARWKVIGMIAGKHWAAIITYREGRRRIISVRRARRREAEIYDRFAGRNEADNR